MVSGSLGTIERYQRDLIPWYALFVPNLDTTTRQSVLRLLGYSPHYCVPSPRVEEAVRWRVVLRPFGSSSRACSIGRVTCQLYSPVCSVLLFAAAKGIHGQFAMYDQAGIPSSLKSQTRVLCD